MPSYAGTLELRTTAEGIVIINELPVETYLCKVVPSEMPASYELEALKAQAVWRQELCLPADGRIWLSGI